MDAENAGGARNRLLEAVPSPDGEVAAEILATCPTVDVVAGEPYLRSSLPAGALLIVEQGFVVPRSAPPRMNRSIITCDAGPGRVVLPPASEVTEITGGTEVARPTIGRFATDWQEG
jgi:hypothetical protein